MADLSTTYLGLKLKNPVIVSSSGLTNSVNKIEKLAGYGAGAVVLKSLFEEQINYEAGSMLQHSDYPEARDYLKNYTKNNSLEEYLTLIEQTKKAVDIPVIASINCVSANEWVSFAKKIEDAGADALELNVFYVPLDKEQGSERYENVYYELVTKIKDFTSLPLAIKLGPYFTNLLQVVNKLYFRGVAGAVLFNRFYAPDIDITNLNITSGEVFSSPADIRQSLRWIGIVSENIDKIDLSASTGNHDGEAVIKQLLAGATTVQVCSTLYKNGVEYLQKIIEDVANWMNVNSYDFVSDFRGKLNYKNIPDPAVFERTQFMKYFSGLQ